VDIIVGMGTIVSGTTVPLIHLPELSLLKQIFWDEPTMYLGMKDWLYVGNKKCAFPRAVFTMTFAPMRFVFFVSGIVWSGF
jgi:hypothetical protein